MDVIYQRCAGVDVHKKSVVACVLVTQPDGAVCQQVRSFGTMTADLAALSAWLRAQQGSAWRSRAPASIGSPSSTCSTRTATA